jgi:transposase-like protein
VPFRKLGDENKLSGKQVYTKVISELSQLPDNTLLTKTLCDPRRFSGILIIDGKYVAVKGFSAKIPFIYAIDYLTHDIPYGHLYVAEDEMSFSHFFQKLYDVGYDIHIVVADDRAGIKQALHKLFPRALLQLCQNHYLENIRVHLRIRSEERYRHFFHSLKLHVFTEARDEESISLGLAHVLEKHALRSPKLQDILWDIKERSEVLFQYQRVPYCPNNTNLIELYNSHLNGRLKTIKGFQSFQSAERWLNAYLIRRRTKLLTDCEGKFKHLNKHCSLELTIKKQALWPEILTKLGVKVVKFFKKIS